MLLVLLVVSAITHKSQLLSLIAFPGRLSIFCSQNCFKKNWAFHNRLHSVMSQSRVGMGQASGGALLNAVASSATDLPSDKKTESDFDEMDQKKQEAGEDFLPCSQSTFSTAPSETAPCHESSSASSMLSKPTTCSPALNFQTFINLSNSSTSAPASSSSLSPTSEFLRAHQRIAAQPKDSSSSIYSNDLLDLTPSSQSSSPFSFFDVKTKSRNHKYSRCSRLLSVFMLGWISASTTCIQKVKSRVASFRHHTSKHRAKRWLLLLVLLFFAVVFIIFTGIKTDPFITKRGGSPPLLGASLPSLPKLSPVKSQLKNVDEHKETATSRRHESVVKEVSINARSPNGKNNIKEIDSEEERQSKEQVVRGGGKGQTKKGAEIRPEGKQGGDLVSRKGAEVHPEGKQDRQYTDDVEIREEKEKPAELDSEKETEGLDEGKQNRQPKDAFEIHDEKNQSGKSMKGAEIREEKKEFADLDSKKESEIIRNVESKTKAAEERKNEKEKEQQINTTNVEEKEKKIKDKKEDFLSKATSKSKDKEATNEDEGKDAPRIQESKSKKNGKSDKSAEQEDAAEQELKLRGKTDEDLTKKDEIQSEVPQRDEDKEGINELEKEDIATKSRDKAPAAEIEDSLRPHRGVIKRIGRAEGENAGKIRETGQNRKHKMAAGSVVGS